MAVLRLAWELLPLFVLVLVVLAAFVLDPEAVVRLAWACVDGTFGKGVQVAGAVVLVAGAAAIAWAFWPEPAEPPRRRAAASRKASPRAKRARAAPDEFSQTESAPLSRQTAKPEPAMPDLPADASGVAQPDASAAASKAQRAKPRATRRKAGPRTQGRNGVVTTAAE